MAGAGSEMGLEVIRISVAESAAGADLRIKGTEER